MHADDLTPYRTYRGDPPPAIELEKYELSVAAKTAAIEGRYLEAVRLKRRIAGICRDQGKKRDAYLLDVGAYELLARCYDQSYQTTLKTLVRELAALQAHDRGETLQQEDYAQYFKSSKTHGDGLRQVPNELLEVHEREVSIEANKAVARGDQFVAATLKEIVAWACRRQGKKRAVALLESHARELRRAHNERKRP